MLKALREFFNTPYYSKKVTTIIECNEILALDLSKFIAKDIAHGNAILEQSLIKPLAQSMAEVMTTRQQKIYPNIPDTIRKVLKEHKIELSDTSECAFKIHKSTSEHWAMYDALKIIIGDKILFEQNNLNELCPVKFIMADIEMQKIADENMVLSACILPSEGF